MQSGIDINNETSGKGYQKRDPQKKSGGMIPASDPVSSQSGSYAETPRNKGSGDPTGDETRRRLHQDLVVARGFQARRSEKDRATINAAVIAAAPKYRNA